MKGLVFGDIFISESDINTINHRYNKLLTILDPGDTQNKKTKKKNENLDHSTIIMHNFINVCGSFETKD